MIKIVGIIISNSHSHLSDLQTQTGEVLPKDEQIRAEQQQKQAEW